MIKAGITGGIGSGKTTVCKIFEVLGIPVYYADERAKWLMVNDPDLIRQLKAAFGDEVYFKNGILNRQYLANLIFNDQSKLETINNIVHPAVQLDSEIWNSEHGTVPFTLKEAALFFENGSYVKMDKMITVTAPESLRIQRVIARDHTDEASVKARIDKQLPESEKVKLSDFVINNDGSQSLILQVLAIYNQLRA
ncbi:MAG: dephospho-CoA kinase [Saprospiraceae bacterium]|jgi:dephospho-CoA kinase